jgi:SpoVK/Ycf46/Vps4 family AAA+-type ATPase
MSKDDTNDWMLGSVLEPLEPGPLPIIPKVLWEQIQEWILSWKHADALHAAGLQAPGALLLHGPTGTGKTSLARAILKYMPGRPGAILETHNILTEMFGESERNVAKGFHLAESYGALLVIEEIDGLGLTRNKSSSSESNARITIALMRCLESSKVPVIATTNFKDHLDPALLRRFELQIEVPELDEKGRAIVLKKILGMEPPAELVAMPLTESIRVAHRVRRRAFLAEQEAKG